MLFEQVFYTIGLYFVLCWLFDVEDIYTMSRRQVHYLPDFKAIWLGVVSFIDGFLLRGEANVDVINASVANDVSDASGDGDDGEALAEIREADDGRDVAEALHGGDGVAAVDRGRRERQRVDQCGDRDSEGEFRKAVAVKPRVKGFKKT